MLLLFLTGCRVSELTLITFKDIGNYLKDNIFKIWTTKDNKQRVIYLSNKYLLNKLENLYNSFYEFTKNNGLVISNSTSFFIKQKKLIV